MPRSPFLARGPAGQAARSRFFGFAIEQAQDAVFCRTDDGRFVYVNEAACRSLGYARAELLALNVRDIDPDHTSGSLAVHSARLRDHRSLTFETRHRRKDGSCFPVEITAAHVELEGQAYSCAFVRDLTPHQEAAEALRQERDLVRGILEASPDPIIITDLDHVVVDCNRATRDASGLALEELVGRSAFDFVAPADRERVREGVRRLFSEGELRGQERLLRGALGDVPAVVSTGIVRDAAGAPQRLVMVVKDIAERRRAELALERSEHLYRTTVDALEEWLHVVDAELRFVLMNEPFRRINASLGFAGDITGRSLTDIFPFLDDTRLEQYRAVIREGRRVVTTETTVVGGRTYVTETKKLPVFEGDRVARVVTVVKDVTALQQAEEARRESEGRFRAVFDSADDCIFLKDRAGRYTQANPAVERLFGRPAAELVGLTHEDLLGPAEREETQRTDHEALGGAVVRHEQSITIQGEQRTFSIVKVPLRDPSGVTVGLCAIARDITQRLRAAAERQQFEAYLQQMQKLDSLGVLAGGIAHDFNNLLTTILGHAELALTDLPTGSRARRDVQKIVTGARRAAELTQQMLAYSGRGKLASEVLSLSELVEEMAHLCEVSIPRRAQLTCEIADELPGVEADPAQLRQVVLNLVLNAGEAIGDEGGTITVRTGVRDCDRRALGACALGQELPEGPYVFLEVADTGCGIGPAVMARIFEPFFTTKFTGRGLGLAAVLGIVRGHRGAILVDSAPGRGTTFRVLFPAHGSLAEVRATEGGLGEWRGHGTVLLVDDEATIRNLAREMLQRLGFAVRCTAGGRGALRALRGRADDLVAVLLDESIPDMNTLDLVRSVRALHPTLPVVLASTGGDAAASRRFAGAGLAGVVQKPFLMDELRERIRTATEKPPAP